MIKESSIPLAFGKAVKKEGFKKALRKKSLLTDVAWIKLTFHELSEAKKICIFFQ
ncbi:hypothetical protein [Spirosoma luteum]|uniref:hypothetical protein n=1 Tax=Spirosoma luteum TaxID=431553 RepID=UPI0003A1A52E|nr:hypothetical protein [Spirosoma luteum]